MGGEMQPNPDCFWASVQPGSGQSGNGSNRWFKTGWAGNSPNEFFFYNNSSNAFFALFFCLLGFLSYNSPKLFFPLFFGQKLSKLDFFALIFSHFFLLDIFSVQYKL
jgi:hypothetical protein